MKLLTHNLFMCNKKGCTTNNFPLKLIANKMEFYSEDQLVPYSDELVKRLLEKLDYPALYNTVVSLQLNDCKPLPPPTEGGVIDQAWLQNPEFLETIYEVCCKRHITEGAMQCPNCGREYQIKNGIANMLLNEDEV